MYLDAISASQVKNIPIDDNLDAKWIWSILTKK